MEFNIDEIFEMAQQLERNGAKYYRRAATKTDDPVIRERLNSLAAMEDEHERTFAFMRAALVEGGQREALFESEDIVQQYLWAWADRHVFKADEDPESELSDDVSMEEILTTAIEREKDSIVFYEGMREALASEEERQKLELIIKEELGHIALLARELQNLM